MVYQLIGTRGQAIAWRNPEKLRQALGFADGDEMKNYMTDDHGRFLPYFMEYAEKWIWPAQKDANEKGTSRQRGVGIDLVEACLIAGESLGNEKFSGEEELGSRKDWQQVDHLALLLYKLRKANTKSTKGLFFGKGLSDTIINDQLWALIKHAEYHLAPARVIKKPMSQKSKGKQPEKSDSSSRTSQPFANATERFIKVFGRRNLEETDADVSPKGSPAPSDENIEAIVGNIRVRFDDDEPAMPPAVNDDDLELTLGSSKQLTNAQRMALECNTDRFDIDYRFWVCWLINTALRDDAQWSQTKKDIEWVTQDLHHVADAESQAWFKTVATGMDQDYVTLQPFDEDLVAEFDRQQQFVDSESYQREDLGASCELLQIKWRGLENTVYRIAGMALSQTMCFWQPVAVKALHDFSMDPTIQGCILADVMGLGKTWVVVVYLIWVLKRRPFTTMQHEPRPMARPTLILVPKALINQWMKQIQMIAPGQFDVRKYHGDTRRHRPVVAEMTIDEHLTKSNVIFDGREERASIIVISSFTTWAYRHGPKAQHKWRLDNGWTRTSTDRAFIELDREWPGSLSHCFNIAVADEAQSLKSLTSHGNYALRWLSTSFNILATGTPIPNGPDDIKGLLPFLERPESESWWTPAILKDMGVDSKVNPYSLSDDHPAARLRITARAVDYWIHSSRWSSVEKGQRIHQIWKRCMIRRTHSSMIPFKTGRVIGDQLPKIQAIFVHCNHTPQEKTDYKEQEDAITGKLFASDVGKPKKQKITLGVIRKLTMLTLWTELPAIDEIYGLKAADIKIAMAKDRYYMEWFDKPCTTKLTVAIRVTLLKRMLKGAPKMRALLQNLTSQVVRDQEKAGVFCQLPGTSLYVYTMLRLAGIKAILLASYQTEAEREQVIQVFTENPTEAMVLVSVYSLSAIGLNLQPLCWWVHLLESYYNISIGNQCIHRFCRVGSPAAFIHVLEYHLEEEFSNQELKRSISKAIPEVMAMLNRTIFGNLEADDPNTTIDLGEWIWEDGRLVRMEDAVLSPNEIPVPLTTESIIQGIIMATKGTWVYGGAERPKLPS